MLGWILDLDLWLNVGAVALAVVGCVLLLWALLGDPARGRRRCPRCWYDMAGMAGRRCPECGKEAKRERSLRKWRRRWGWALAGAGVLAMAHGLRTAVHVRANGWWWAVPRTVLIAGIPWWDDVTGRLSSNGSSVYLHAMIDVRLADTEYAGTDALWVWQRWLARSLAAPQLRREGLDLMTRRSLAAVYAASGGTIDDGFGEEAAAEVVLRRMHMAYGRVDRLTLIGKVRSIDDGDVEIASALLAFERDGVSRYESFNALTGERVVIWGTASGAMVVSEPGGVEEMESFREGCAQSLVTHRGFTFVLRSLHWQVTPMFTRSRFIRYEDVGGERCALIGFGSGMRMWVSVEDWLIRRSEEEHRVVEFDVDTGSRWFEFPETYPEVAEPLLMSGDERRAAGVR